MAHAIDQTTGRAAVFVTGEPAWHRLGTVIEQATTKPGLDGKRAEISPKQTKPYPRNRLSAQGFEAFWSFRNQNCEDATLRNRFD